jgi:hypothetical protein
LFSSNHPRIYTISYLNLKCSPSSVTWSRWPEDHARSTDDVAVIVRVVDEYHHLHAFCSFTSNPPSHTRSNAHRHKRPGKAHALASCQSTTAGFYLLSCRCPAELCACRLFLFRCHPGSRTS